MKKNILITGCSSGLGFALTNYYLQKGFKVYGISRNKPEIQNQNFIHISFDLSKISEIKNSLTNILKEIKNLDLVFLNAGVNMLVNLYSNEMFNTKIIALAPGVIKTPMTDYIRFELDENIFTSAKKLNEGLVQTPLETAIKIDAFINRIDEFETGSYVDIRQI